MAMRVRMKVDAPEGEALVERDGRLYNLARFWKAARRVPLPMPALEVYKPEPAAEPADEPAAVAATQKVEGRTAVAAPEAVGAKHPPQPYDIKVLRDGRGIVSKLRIKSLDPAIPDWDAEVKRGGDGLIDLIRMVPV